MSDVSFIGDAEFQEKVIDSDIPVLIDFYADWCGPCKMITPVVEQIADDYKSKLAVYKLNVDENPLVAASYQVMSIPTLLVFRDGKPVSSVIGAVSYKILADKINEILGD